MASLGASQVPETLRRYRLSFGGDDPAAIGAGLGSLFPLRVWAFRPEVISSKVSQYRTVVLDNIPGYAFPVPALTLAFNCPNYHIVKLHSLAKKTLLSLPLRSLWRG